MLCNISYQELCFAFVISLSQTKINEINSKKAVSISLSYTEYRNLVAIFADEGKTTGEIPTEDHIVFTKLNEQECIG